MAEGAPPALAGGILNAKTLQEMMALGKLGLGLKRLGKVEMREFLRVILSNAYDLILDELWDGPLAGALAADAVNNNSNNNNNNKSWTEVNEVQTL